MGRKSGFWKDIGKVGLNALANPLEMVTGQNFYNPEMEGKWTSKAENYQDFTGKIGAKILPTLANAVVPGSGTAIQLGRAVMPDIANDGKNNSFQGAGPNLTNSSQLDATANSALYEMGGSLSAMAIQGAGPNLYAFDGPSHEEGGFKFNESAELEKKETVDPKAGYVYSDKTIVPGTDKTFADASKKWKGSSTDDDITKKTNQLMLDRLRNNQEELKEQDFKKAVKRFEKKYGGYMKQKKQEAMAKGGYYTPQEANAAGEKFVNKQTAYGSNAGNYSGTTQYFDGGALLSAFSGGGGGDISSILSMLGGGGDADISSIMNMVGGGQGGQGGGHTHGQAGGNPMDMLKNIDPQAIEKFLPLVEKFAGSFKHGGYMQPMTYGGPMHQMPDGSMMPGATHEEAMQMGMYGDGGGLTKYKTGGGFMEGVKNFFNPDYKPWTAENNYGLNVDVGGKGYKFGNMDKALERQQADMDGTLEQPFRFNSKNVGRGLEEAGQYANIAYNLNQGRKPVDYYKGQYNDEYDKAIDLVSGMEYNADPQIAEAQKTFEQSKQAIQDMAGGNSAVALANVGGAQMRADQAKQRILAAKDNADNQYDLTEAQTRANLGAQKAQEKSLVEMSRLKADAAKRKFTADAMKETSEKAQMSKKMRGQKEKDEMLTELLGMSYGDLSKFADILGKGKTTK